MDEKCKCGKPIDNAWPGNDGDTICQDCWEAQCDKSWWEVVVAIDTLLNGGDQDKRKRRANGERAHTEFGR